MPGFGAAFDVRVYPEIGSTNAEALRQAAAGERGPLWLRADRQTAGKGRSGRAWVSEPGNLYATLLLTLDCPHEVIGQLSLVTGVAVHRAIGEAAGADVLDRLALKWPNDVLVGEAKCAGVLSESFLDPSTRLITVAIGIGINLTHSPSDLERKVTSLQQQGVEIGPAAMLSLLDERLRHAISVWGSGSGFDAIRRDWLASAHAVGQKLGVNTGSGYLEGEFRGLADDGALILRDQDGYEHRVTFGDVAVVPSIKEK